MKEQTGRRSGASGDEVKRDGAAWDAAYALYLWALWCGDPDDGKNIGENT